MEQRKHSISRRGIHLLPAGIIVAGIIACAVCATISETYWDFLGLLIFIALASLLSGVVLGFLFGVPRLNRNYDPGDDYGRTTKYHPNTNLEEVSDWLTKIIIGVTLTQLTQIPGYLQGIAGHITANINCETLPCDFAKPVIISLIIYFIIAGFIIGYLYTRVYLPNLFAIMEENRIKEAEIAIWRAGTKEMMQWKEEGPMSSPLASLTGEEIGILKKIGSQNNELSGNRGFTARERAAVNVLMAKGILESRDAVANKGTVVRIADKGILDELKVESEK